MFGAGEARAVREGGRIDHPAHYIRDQVKLVEPEDEAWGLGGD